ncbi:MAG: leucine-rich repeat protein [Bacteroidales bacterium]|nr:leucine-rich repeat protein [Bacteroidales bacterium]
MKFKSIIIAFLSILMVSCQKEIPVSSVSLSEVSLSLVEGEFKSLVATVLPDNATDKSVEWESRDESVATVRAGVVTALKEGSTTITVKTANGGKTASCSVTVLPKHYSVSGISLDRTSAEMEVGQQLTLTATVLPENATNKNITWSSSDNSIAEINDGTVTAIEAGNATITVTTEDGEKTASCSITVVYRVTGISLDMTEAELEVGENLELTATVLPENASDKSIFWSSSNEEIARVQNGIVTPVDEGSAVITATTSDGGLTASCNLTIKDVPIIFEDEYVLARISQLVLYDDGMMTKAEAAKITYLEPRYFGEFQGLVTSFPEFQYYISINWISSPSFAGCENLRRIVLPESVHIIGDKAFFGCSNLEEINFSDQIVNIRSFAFAGCHSLKQCFIPQNATHLLEGMYWECSSIQEINIPETVVSIGNQCFYGCSSIKEIIIPDSVTNLEGRAFWGCSSATTIRISSNVESLQYGTFMGTAARIITIPEGVQVAQQHVFSSSPQLEELTIPSTMVEMDEICANCGNLKTVYCNAVTPPALLALPFTERPDWEGEPLISTSLQRIYVPAQSVEAYRSADIWKEYADKIRGIDF